MKQNGVLVTLLVDDYDAALKFYVRELGLFELVADTHISESSRYVCIALKEFVDKFMINLKKPTTRKGTNFVGCQAGDDVLMTLPVSDIEKLHADLKAKSIVIDSEIEWVPYGGGACVTDPFGNRVSLFEHFVSQFA